MTNQNKATGWIPETATGGESLPLVSAGVHPAVCYEVYYFGTHHDERYNKNKPVCSLGFEILNEQCEIAVKDSEGKPTDQKRAKEPARLVDLLQRQELWWGSLGQIRKPNANVQLLNRLGR